MKYGIQLGGGASVSQRDSLKKLATAAEELGFDSLLNRRPYRHSQAD